MKKLIFTTTITLLLTVSCSDAQKARREARGSDFRIEMLNSNGDIVKAWISSGKVRSKQNSEGYYFKDKATDLLVEVTGSIIITQIPENGNSN